MGYDYSQQGSFFTQGSTATQSPWVFTGDYKRLSIQIAGSGSNFTIEGSNDNGFTAAIANASQLTVLTAAGEYSITPGCRWMRFGRPGSTVTATYHGSAA